MIFIWIFERTRSISFFFSFFVWFLLRFFLAIARATRNDLTIFFFRKNTNCYSYLYRGGRLIFAKNSVLILRNAQKKRASDSFKDGGLWGRGRGGHAGVLGPFRGVGGISVVVVHHCWGTWVKQLFELFPFLTPFFDFDFFQFLRLFWVRLLFVFFFCVIDLSVEELLLIVFF